MLRHLPAAALISAAVLLHITPLWAHAVCGSRVFPVTLTLDDPGVADELTLPQALFTRTAADGGLGPGHDTSWQFEYDKRVTEDFGFAFNDDYNVNQTDHSETQSGWDDLTVTAKWAKCVDPDDDFQLGFGVIREFGRTGTSHTGADEYGNTAPTIYLGKGLDEIPVPMLQPLQFSGEFSFDLADKAYKSFGGENNLGSTNQLFGSFSIQYSIPYLQTQIKDYGLPEPLAHLIPVAEFDWTSPTTNNGNAPTTWVVAPGVIYLRTWYQIGVEALIPLNKAAGSNVGAIVQLHVFLDDLYPHSIGAPLLDF